MKKRTPAARARAPKQERGIKTREKIIKAARRIFARKGFYGTDSNEIAAAAGVSTGSFYAYFNGKKDLFIETLRLYNREVLEKTFREFEKLKDVTDKRELISVLIKKIIDAHNLSPEFHREAIAMTYMDSDISAIQAEEDKKVISALESFIMQNRESIKVRNIRAAAAVIFKSTETIVHSIKISNDHRDENGLLDELTQMIYSYLFT